jgi:hypothetical protein
MTEEEWEELSARGFPHAADAMRKLGAEVFLIKRQLRMVDAMTKDKIRQEIKELEQDLWDLDEELCALETRREVIWKRLGVLEAEPPAPYPTNPDDIGPLA